MFKKQIVRKTVISWKNADILQSASLSALVKDEIESAAMETIPLLKQYNINEDNCVPLVYKHHRRLLLQLNAIFTEKNPAGSELLQPQKQLRLCAMRTFFLTCMSVEEHELEQWSHKLVGAFNYNLRQLGSPSCHDMIFFIETLDYVEEGMSIAVHCPVYEIFYQITEEPLHPPPTDAIANVTRPSNAMSISLMRDMKSWGRHLPVYAKQGRVGASQVPYLLTMSNLECYNAYFSFVCGFYTVEQPTLVKRAQLDYMSK